MSEKNLKVQSTKSSFFRITDVIFRFLSSLRLAVISIIGLSASLAAATVIESLYDTPTGKYWVYNSWWFRGLLLMLGTNILCVALSRYPWKKHHGPFLTAHVGIMTLLIGAWITDQYGLDGHIRLNEGESSSQVELDDPKLLISDGDSLTAHAVKWTPPGAKFSPMDLPKFDLKVDQYITFADPSVSFIPAETDDRTALPAVQLIVKGGPMKITQEYWMWLGDPSWSMLQAGPAFLLFTGLDSKGGRLPHAPEQAFKVVPGRPQLDLKVQENGDLLYRAVASSGEMKSAVLKAGEIEGKVIEPGWKGGVTLTVAKWIPRAANKVTYVPSKTQYGTNAPSSAVHVVAGKGGPGSEMWLGLGDRAVLRVAGRDIGLGYMNQKVAIPFAVRLEHFNIDYWDGTRDPKSYASKVSVLDPKITRANMDISMNEPLEHGGITFYQASYENGDPRPTVSIFSVNRDPGRAAKYWGSILLVLGAAWLFANKYRKNKKAIAAQAKALAARNVQIPSEAKV